MVEEASAKCLCGETSDQSSNLNDVHVPSEKLDYTTTLEKVDLLGKETMEVVCTSEPDKADEMICRLWKRAGGLYPRFIDIDVEYTRPKSLNDMLKHEKLFTFADFSIQGDKEKLKMSGLEINPNKYIDIQRNWRVPYTGKEYDSLADVAANVIHPFYKGMKKKIDRKEYHKLWGISPLPNYLIEYAAIDVYATYESWKKIDNIKTCLEISKEQEADPYYHYHYAG